MSFKLAKLAAVSIFMTLGLLSEGLSAPKVGPIQKGSPGQSDQQGPVDSSWKENQLAVSIRNVRQNISPEDGLPGVVIASPSRQAPDYYFHWIRDAALTMDVVLGLYRRAEGPEQKEQWLNILKDFSRLSRMNQLSFALTGFGEPKFHVDGRSYQGPWGRPQNDGPALRALVLSRFAMDLLDQGEADFVRTWLYRPELPANTVIKADLEYTVQSWREPSFDLWEEVKGQHFYTLMAQRGALLIGAQLARRLQDPFAADHYDRERKAIEKVLDSHWSEKLGLFLPTINVVEGVNYKNSHIDIAVLLSVLHNGPESYVSLQDPRLKRTVEKTIQAFKGLYPINQISGSQGVAIGRYPEDVYSGNGFDGGNPWVLTTLAVAEYYYLLAAGGHAGHQQKSIKKSQLKGLLKKADSFMERVRFHLNPDGSMSEQMDRHSGFMTSARDLTWSYSAFITAFWAKEEALKKELK